jgi:Family of unknown function (DUF5941)
VALHRDDGPFARALASVLAPLVPVPALLLIVAALVPLLAAAAIGDLSRPAAAAVLAWTLVLAGVSAGRPSPPRIRWAELPLIRLTEYAGLIWIASLEGSRAFPAAFALLAALAFRHYDLPYRLRQRRGAPGRWLNRLSGGWDGRLLVGFVLLLAGALPAGFYVAAALLGTVFVGEAVARWVAPDRSTQTPVDYEDENL